MNSDQPYAFPKDTGTLTAPILQDYASWLFPKLKLEWQAPGVEKRPGTVKERDPKQQVKPFTFRKSKGWLNLQKDLRPFAAYIMQKLIKWANRKPYLPARKTGMALMQDLIELNAHVQILLGMKKAEQSREKPVS